MKERPILFSGEMVRAILVGRKTQTRRVGRYQRDDATELGVESFCHATKGWGLHATYAAFPGKGSARWALCECPYGIPGDRLWVREEHYQYGHWEPVEGVKTKGGKPKWKFVPDSEGYLFYEPDTFRKGRHHLDPATAAWHKRLARFMPKDFTRITLEIVSVRVERLNEISEADAKAEGVEFGHHPSPPATARFNHTAKGAYDELWERINGNGSWNLNPWVWVVEFKRVEVAS